ncbi:MAG TPA: polysaccharide deacetylase family protein [Syntrophomonadaceae bacterium]|nr:polysaccharide deacetylase family protein [Syntrophomonadaceae bacterium]
MEKKSEKRFNRDLALKVGLLLFAIAIAVSPVMFLSARSNLPINTVDASNQTTLAPKKYIRVDLNDRPLHSGAVPFTIGDRALVPLRKVAEAAGATVSWDKPSNSIKVVCGDKTIKLNIDKNKAYINDQETTLEVAPSCVNGVTLVPVNFIKDPLGINVNWDSQWQTLHVYTKDYVPSPPPHKVSQPQSFPILMYHELGDGPNNLYVRESEFREQMKYLKDNNYRVVTLSEAMRMLQDQESMDKVVALTFDDGYVSFLTIGWPILQQYDFHATLFVITYHTFLATHLNWDQINMMEADWNEIGSHTNNHPALSKISSFQLKEEVAGSKQLLESMLQVPCETFCYPGGDYNEAVVQAVRDAGYKFAVTTKPGRATLKEDVSLISRVRIPRGMSIQSYAYSLKEM